MKAVINCRTPLSSWQNEYFPEIAEYMLPIVGKPLIEFYVDWCSLSGINDILFVFEDFDEDTINFLSDGSRWGVNISAVTAPTDADRKADRAAQFKIHKRRAVFLSGRLLLSALRQKFGKNLRGAIRLP